MNGTGRQNRQRARLIQSRPICPKKAFCGQLIRAHQLDHLAGRSPCNEQTFPIDTQFTYTEYGEENPRPQLERSSECDQRGRVVRLLSLIAETSALRHAKRSRPVLFPAFPFSFLIFLTPCSQIAQLQRCEPITEEEVKQLCLKAREILIEEGNVQVVDSPVTVRSLFCVSRSRTDHELDMW